MYFNLCVSYEETDRNIISHMYTDILKTYTQSSRWNVLNKWGRSQFRIAYNLGYVKDSGTEPLRKLWNVRNMNLYLYFHTVHVVIFILLKTNSCPGIHTHLDNIQPHTK
jgi:hypothetical protein